MSKKAKKAKKAKKRKLLIVKIGSDERPAGPNDVELMKEELKKFSKKGMAIKGYDIIVTHHCAEFDFLNIP